MSKFLAEQIVRDYNRSFRQRGCSCPSHQAEGAAEHVVNGVTFLLVGFNSSHSFYLGWDAENRLWQTSYGGYDDNLPFEEALTASMEALDPSILASAYLGHY